MKKPKIAILDADIIAYKAACWVDIEGVDDLEARLRDDVRNWTPSGITDIVVAFSCPRKKNFRRDSWPSYKAKRDSQDSPEHLHICREYMMDYWDSITEPRLEADDILGIRASSGDMIAVTIDKDLKSVPGYHWNPDKDKDVRYITQEEADRFFITQWMMGDSTDGIPGLWRIGPKKAEKLMNEWEQDEWVENIIDMYEDPKYTPEASFIPYQIALAMARCVRILRDGEYDFLTKEITLWDPKVGANNEKELIE